MSLSQPGQEFKGLIIELAYLKPKGFHKGII